MSDDRPERPARARQVDSSAPPKSAYTEANASTTGAVPVGIGDIPIPIGARWYLTPSVLVAVASSLVGGTYAIINYLEVRPAIAKAADLQQIATSAETERQTLKSQYERLTVAYNELLKNTERPVLAFPYDGASVIGPEQSFIWDYKKHDSVSGYIFEIRSISGSVKLHISENVIRPEAKRTFYSLKEVPAAEYIWRIRPGELVDGREVAQGEWSNPASFSVFATVEDRIRATGTMTMATTPTSYDSFIASDGNGDYRGFEIDFVNYLAAELTKRLGLAEHLKVKSLEIPWTELFGVMQRGQADIAVRSITKSAVREREYPNLRFSEGYVTNHQIFIQTRHEGTFPESLQNTVVGAKANSLNEQVARFLASKYQFRVDASYVAYGDLYQALRSGSVNFALVDATLAGKFLNDQFFQFGGNLDSELESYYARELGQKFEEYAVLVHDAGPKEHLRSVINEIITSPEGRSFLRSLRQKYKLEE